MSKLKVMTVVGTRPEIIRLSRTMQVLDDVCDHVTVHTGQNYDYELNEVFYRDLGLRKPDHFLGAAGRTAAETIGQVIAKVDEVLAAEKPEAMLVLGDTNSCLAVIPAKRRRIPVFHMEAGNRCFDMRVPEEINRRIVDHVSDINLTYSEHSRRYLLAEGIAASDVHARLGLEKGRYFTVSIHREENVDDPAHLASLVAALNALAERYGHPLVFSVHPRTRKRLDAAGVALDPSVRAMPPMGFLDYNALQLHAFCAVSDSGTITEESSILGFPAITVREAHERPEGMDEGVVVMSGLRPERILQSVEMTRHQFDRFGPARLPDDYDVPNVSWKVAKIILGYTDYVRRVVWMAAEPSPQ